MKKKKEKYSLTASQRKSQRQVEEQKSQPKKSFDQLTDDEKAVVLAEKESKKQKSKKISRLVAIVLAAVLAVGSIAAGITLLVLSNQIDNDKTNPVATITLSNNTKIEMTLYYDKDHEEVRAATATFIYLALNGFYNNTIFLANEQDTKFLLMAGLTAPDKHRAQETFSYITKLKGFMSVHNDSSFDTSNAFKLGFRLAQKGEKYDQNNEKGRVAFMTGSSSNIYGTSTSIMLLGANNNQFTQGNATIAPTYFAKMTDKSVQTINNILSNKGFTNTVKHNVDWLYSQDDGIKIESIKIDKLSSKLRKTILNNFEEFVLSSTSTMDGALKGEVSRSWQKKMDGYFDKDVAI